MQRNVLSGSLTFIPILGIALVGCGEISEDVDDATSVAPMRQFLEDLTGASISDLPGCFDVAGTNATLNRDRLDCYFNERSANASAADTDCTATYGLSCKSVQPLDLYLKNSQNTIVSPCSFVVTKRRVDATSTWLEGYSAGHCLSEDGRKLVQIAVNGKVALGFKYKFRKGFDGTLATPSAETDFVWMAARFAGAFATSIDAACPYFPKRGEGQFRGPDLARGGIIKVGFPVWAQPGGSAHARTAVDGFAFAWDPSKRVLTHQLLGNTWAQNMNWGGGSGGAMLAYSPHCPSKAMFVGITSQGFGVSVSGGFTYRTHAPQPVEYASAGWSILRKVGSYVEPPAGKYTLIPLMPTHSEPWIYPKGGISPSGQFVAATANVQGLRRAFRYNVWTKSTQILSNLGGTAESRAHAVRNDGLAVGSTGTLSAKWLSTSTAVQPICCGSYQDGTAAGIDEAGSIVGYSSSGGGWVFQGSQYQGTAISSNVAVGIPPSSVSLSYDRYVWGSLPQAAGPIPALSRRSTSGFLTVESLPMPTGCDIGAVRGSVTTQHHAFVPTAVGNARCTDGIYRAVAWTFSGNEIKATKLQPPSVSFKNTFASSVNHLGDIVGGGIAPNSAGADRYYAWMKRADEQTPRLLESNAVDCQNNTTNKWLLTKAYGIADNGTILAEAYNLQDNILYWVVLRPGANSTAGYC